MSDKQTNAWSLVLVPALVTLAVTVLRLVGELQGWNPTLFSNSAPGGPDQRLGIVGISWLIFVFGFWFGWKLRRGTGGPEHAGKSALWFALGAAILVGGFFGLVATGLLVMPKADAPGEPSGLGYSLALALAAALVMVWAWPRLAATLLLYGVLARVPVVAVTWLALQNGWDTHYTKLPVGTTLPAGASLFGFLATPQLTFWIVTTLMIGGLCGCLGAALARRKQS
jgi:hypothetical protein